MIGISLATVCLNALAAPPSQPQQLSQPRAINPSVPSGNVVIQGKTATGSSQTTVIDSNGNLKIVEPNKSQADQTNEQTSSQANAPMGDQMGQQPIQRVPQQNQPLSTQTLPQNVPQQASTPLGPQTMTSQPNQQPIGPQNPSQQVMAPPPPAGMSNQMPQGTSPQGGPQQIGPPEGGGAVTTPMPNQQSMPTQNAPTVPRKY